MATARIGTMIRQLGAAANRREAVQTDGQLLTAVIDRKDEAAFESIVHRHGAMVFRVCHRIVRSHHDAEDAFQATFLVLARRATSVRPREKLAAFLYGVACRTAMKARASRRRRARERQVPWLPEPEATCLDSTSDLQPILDQELRRLPEKYRLPILLCDLEGKTIQEATVFLGWRQGTFAGRLTRGRKLLARRLASRGVALSTGSIASVVFQQTATAAPALSLLTSTISAARHYLGGYPMNGGALPARVAALTEGVARTMLLNRMTCRVVVFAAFAVVCGGGLLGALAAVSAEDMSNSADHGGELWPAPQSDGRKGKSEPTREPLCGRWRVVYAETFLKTMKNGETTSTSGPQSLIDAKTYTFSSEEARDLQQGKWGGLPASYVLEGDVLILRTTSEKPLSEQERTQRLTLRVLHRTEPAANTKTASRQQSKVEDGESFRTPLLSGLPARQEGRMTYLDMPHMPPSEAAILRACSSADRAELGDDLRVFCELISYRLEGPRFYPLVGEAKLAKAHYKCLVQGSRGQKVLYVDRDQLVLEQR